MNVLVSEIQTPLTKDHSFNEASYRVRESEFWNQTHRFIEIRVNRENKIRSSLFLRLSRLEHMFQTCSYNIALIFSWTANIQMFLHASPFAFIPFKVKMI